MGEDKFQQKFKTMGAEIIYSSFLHGHLPRGMREQFDLKENYFFLFITGENQ